MSPQLLDSNRKLPNRGRAAQSVPPSRLATNSSSTAVPGPCWSCRWSSTASSTRTGRRDVPHRHRLDHPRHPFDQLLEETAEGHYTREFTLEHLALVMLDVVCGYQPSVARLSWIAISSSSPRSRPSTASSTAWSWASPRDVVRRTADAARELIVAAGGLLAEPIPGYAARILDGNVLAGSEHRLKPTRTTWSACLPGKSLAVYEPASGLIVDLVLRGECPHPGTSLLDQVRDRPRRTLDRRPQLLRPHLSVPHRPVRGVLPARQHLRRCRSSPSSRWRPRGDAHRRGLRAADPGGRPPPPGRALPAAADRLAAGPADPRRRGGDRPGDQPADGCRRRSSAARPIGVAGRSKAISRS